LKVTAVTLEALNAHLKSARLAAYAEARGGWPVPLAGALYRAVLAWLGTRMALEDWSVKAAILSGAIFPVAVGLAARVRNPFMKVQVPDQAPCSWPWARCCSSGRARLRRCGTTLRWRRC
jgi:hypothetical protein